MYSVLSYSTSNSAHREWDTTLTLSDGSKIIIRAAELKRISPRRVE